MNEEYESIMKNDVWDVVPRPQDKSIVTFKWLYKIKHGVDGSVDPLIHKCKSELASEFEMKDLGTMHYFLGLEVWQKPGDFPLSRKMCCEDIGKIWDGGLQACDYFDGT